MSKVLAYAPGVAVSTVLTWMLGAMLPAALAWVLFLGGLAAVAVLGVGVGEPAAVRALCRARRLTAAEQEALAPAVALLCQASLGPPLVHLWVQERLEPITSEAVGRRSVLVSGGLIASVRDGRLPASQAAAVIGHAAAVLRCGLTRHDLALRFWTLPWQLLRGLGQGLGAGAALPLARWAWRLRLVLGAIALVQGIAEASPASIAAGTGAAAVIAISYLMPRWERCWAALVREAGDRQVSRAGLAEPLAVFLRRCSSSPGTFERIHALHASVDPPGRPGLAAVHPPGRRSR